MQHQQQKRAGNQQFNNPRQQLNNFGGGLLGKRRGNEPVWQPHLAPKPSSGPQGGAKRKYSAGPNPKPASISNDALLPQPFVRQSVFNLLGPFGPNNIPSQGSHPWKKPNYLMGQKSGPRRPPPNKPLRKDFKRNKAAKPKLATSYGNDSKVKSFNKDKLVQDTKDSYIKSFTLRPDVVPSQLLVGRLESALGHIVKDVIKSIEDTTLHKASVVSPFLMRKIKQLLRQRLRTVMMNKHVGNLNTILEQYRAVFPPETDSKVPVIAQDSEKEQIAIRLPNEDTPEEYLKVNMNRLVGCALDDMFVKIQNIYKSEIFDEIKEAFMDLLEKTDGNIAEDFTKHDDGDEIDIRDIEMEHVESEDPNKNIISNTDEITTTNGENITEAEENVTETEENVADNEENSDNVEKYDDTEEKYDDREAVDKSGNYDKDKNMNPKDMIMLKLKKLNNIICSMIKREIKQIMPKYKPLLLNVLNANAMYKMTSERINADLEEKLSIMYRVKNAENLNSSEQSSVKTSGSSPVNATATPPTDLYYAKIFGRPVLPERKVMQTFLQQFKPKSIKKHRHMHLLLLEFVNKEDYDKIVALKETIIGNATISIKKASANGVLDS